MLPSAPAGPEIRSADGWGGARLALVVGASAVALAGCASPRFADCEVSCAESGLCPSGFECGGDGFCYPEGGGATGEDCADRIDAGGPEGRDGSADHDAVSVTGPAEVVEVRPLGEPVTVAREDPVPMTGCLIAGDSDRDVTYAETDHDVRSRDVVFPSYDEGLAHELELPEDPSLLDLDVADSFDVDPEGTVSSADGVDVLSSTIPAEQQGAFYRQTVQLHHVADLVAVTADSDEYAIGQVAVVDWRFVADLGIDEACPPLPPPPPSLQPL